MINKFWAHVKNTCLVSWGNCVGVWTICSSVSPRLYWHKWKHSSLREFRQCKIGQRESFVSLEHPELFYAAHIPLCTFFSPFNFAFLGLFILYMCTWAHTFTESMFTHEMSHTNAHMHMRAISHTHLYPHTSLCLSLPFSCSSPTSPNNSSAYKT